MSNVINLTEQEFDRRLQESAGLVLVDFYAPWCGPCRMLAPWLEQLATEFAGRVTVAKVNVDEAPELAARYAITGVPTLILFKGGTPLDQAVGLAPPQVLRSWLQDALGEHQPARQAAAS